MEFFLIKKVPRTLNFSPKSGSLIAPRSWLTIRPCARMPPPPHAGRPRTVVPQGTLFLPDVPTGCSNEISRLFQKL
jgi:hypothetical protein